MMRTARKLVTVLGGGASGVTWLLRDEFTTDEAAPLSSPRTAEPGPGEWTIVDADSAILISGSKLTLAGGVLWGEQGVYAGALACSTGTALLARISKTAVPTGFGPFVALNSRTTLVVKQSTYPQLYMRNSGFFEIAYAGSNYVAVYPFVFEAEHDVTIVFNGGYFIKDGGVWKLIWRHATTAAGDYYPAVSTSNSGGTVDYMRVRQLPAPFDTDNGIATLDLTTFTQSLGAELVPNSDFSAWTADNPDDWSVFSESGSDPEVTERDPGQSHADTKTVGGAANFYASATHYAPVIRQDIGVSARSWYEAAITGVTLTSGGFGCGHPLGYFPIPSDTRLAAQAIETLYFDFYPSAAVSDVTVDQISIKAITLNEQQEMPADAIIDFSYTLPASPLVSDRAMCVYRISDETLETAYSAWQAYVEWNTAGNNYNARLVSVASGVATTRINVSNIGSTSMLRIICDGTKHNLYTLSGTTWTKHGGEIDVSHNDDATGLNTVYSSTVTPSRLTVYPRTSALYAELDRT